MQPQFYSKGHLEATRGEISLLCSALPTPRQCLCRDACPVCPSQRFRFENFLTPPSVKLLSFANSKCKPKTKEYDKCFSGTSAGHSYHSSAPPTHGCSFSGGGVESRSKSRQKSTSPVMGAGQVWSLSHFCLCLFC